MYTKTTQGVVLPQLRALFRNVLAKFDDRFWTGPVFVCTKMQVHINPTQRDGVVAYYLHGSY
jgi:hypothetical protein